MTLVYLGSAWLAGLVIGSKVDLPPLALLLGFLPLPFIFLFPNYRRAFLLTGLCLLAFLGGTLRFPAAQPINESSLAFYNDKGVIEIKGIVVTDPESRDVALLLQLSAREIKVAEEWKETSGNTLIRVPRFADYRYGDMLKVTGELKTPPQLDDFDYRGYLARQGIYSIMYYPKIEVLERDKGIKLLSWVYSLRNRLSQSLSLVLSEPQCSVAQGILLGLRGDIPFSFKEALSRTGTAHIFAISGINLTIVIGMLLSLGLWLFGKRYSLYIWPSLIIIWIYVLLTGMKPPVIRGAVMGTVFLMAEYLGRQRSGLTALLFAAAVMAGIHPPVLWDVSFQLSFLAMTGLILLAPHLQAWGRKQVNSALGERGALVSLANLAVDSSAVTLSAIIATWPVIAYSFNIASLVGLPATILALLALPGIIVTSALVAVVGIFVLPLAQILGWVAWLFLTYLILVVKIFDTLPFSSVEVASFQSWQVWCYYVLFVASFWVMSRRQELSKIATKAVSKLKAAGNAFSSFVLRLPLKWTLLVLIVFALLIWIAALTTHDDRLHVTFLNVGQGDAILIQTPNRQDILIDGGPSPQAINLELSKKLPFWDRTLDLVILTQPQADHVTGLVEVLQRYKAKQVLESGIASTSFVYSEWLNLVKTKAINSQLVRAGQEIDLGSGIKLEILNPPYPFYQGTSNDLDNNGVVSRLSWNKVSFLFTADIGQETELELIASRAPLKSTVLKVAHHGSRASTSPQFLAIVAPEVAVISVGEDNRFRHPHPEVMEKLFERLGKNKVFLTSEHGTIEFSTDGEKLWVKTRN